MKYQGWIKLHRALLSDPIWQQSTPSQKSILITALLLANHTENQWIWKGKKYTCSPGQFVTSIRSLAEAAGVTVKAARGAIAKFEKVGFWAQERAQRGAQGGTILTICNWRKYQTIPDGEGTGQGTMKGKIGAHNKNDKKKRSKKYTAFPKMQQADEASSESQKSTVIPSSQKEQSPSQHTYKSRKGKILKGETLTKFEYFWDTFAYRKGKAEAADAFLATDYLSDDVYNGIIQGAQKEATARIDLIEKGKTPKMAQGWLSGRRWEDEGYQIEQKQEARNCSQCKFQNTNACAHCKITGKKVNYHPKQEAIS